MVSPLYRERGIKVRELKEWVNGLEDIDIWGDEAEVWIDTGFCISSVLRGITLLNYRLDDEGIERGDILIEVPVNWERPNGS